MALEFVPGAHVSFDQGLEVSLDCYACQRRCRTIIFKPDKSAGICTPTSHEFPGRLLNFESRSEGNVQVAVLLFEYEHEAFRDAKYPDEVRYRSTDAGSPTWARVSFAVTCPACGQRTQQSTQNNICRPWRCVCRTCRQPLYFETEEMPQLSWRPADSP